MAALTLYVGNKNYSSWSLRPYLALAQVGVPFEEVVIPLKQPDTAQRIAAVSPSGRVPALVHGEVKIWESLAICEYLAEAFPNAGLWPADARARALARAVSSEMHAGFAALRNAMPMNIRARQPLKTIAPEVQADINRVTEIWRTCRKAHGQGGPFLFGTFTIADAMYAPVVTRFRTYGVETGPEETAYREAVEAHPPMRAWAEAAAKEPWTIAAYAPAV